MKTTVCIILILLGLTQTIQAQSKEDIQIKLIEKIVGSWKIQQVVDAKSKKTNAGVTGITALEFSPEGRYRNFAKNVVIDSGSYRLNEPQGKLYLESETNQEKTSEWVVVIQEDKLTMQPQGAQHAAGLQYIFVRTKKGLSTNQD